MNDNGVDLTIMDEDLTKDDVVGSCTVQLANARKAGSDSQQVGAVRACVCARMCVYACMRRDGAHAQGRSA